MPRKAAQALQRSSFNQQSNNRGVSEATNFPSVQASASAKVPILDLFGKPVQTRSHGSRRTLGLTNTPDDGVFGWFKYIQDFPGDFALEWLRRLAKPGNVVWEPFSGSGTTLVAAQVLGLECHGYDINPFMVDVAEAKLDWTMDVDLLKEVAEKVSARAIREANVGPEPLESVKASWAEYQNHKAGRDVKYPGEDDKLHACRSERRFKAYRCPQYKSRRNSDRP